MVSDRTSGLRVSRRFTMQSASGGDGIEWIVGETGLNRFAPAEVLEQEAEAMVYQPADSRHADGVAEAVLGLAPADRDREVAGTLEAGRIPGPVRGRIRG